MRPGALTLQEQFTRTFDVFPFEQPPLPDATTLSTLPSTKRLASSTTGTAHGFGSASMRFQNEVYGCHLAYGKVAKAVIELDDAAPVEVGELGPGAPSRMLPEFAARFQPEPGRTFASTVPRDAPPAADGSQRFWVQPKDTGGLFPGVDEPDIFTMSAPRGAGPPSQMHAAPTQLLTPAERREALVFDKCHERARLALRKAASDACQLTRQMHTRYPHGVIGVEGPGCASSLIYESSRQRAQEAHEKRASHAARRFDNIATKRESQIDYRLISHEGAPNNQMREAIFQRKAVSSLGLRGAPTGDHPTGNYELRPAGKAADGGFRSNQEKPLREPRVGRVNALNNVSTGGKPYDIISGITLPVPPSGNEPSPYQRDRRAHPSNLSIPHRGGTAPTLIGPIPDAHKPSWQPPSPTKAASKSYMR